MASVVVQPPARARNGTVMSPPIVVHSYMSTTDAASDLFANAVAQAFILDSSGEVQQDLLRGTLVTSASHMLDDLETARRSRRRADRTETSSPENSGAETDGAETSSDATYSTAATSVTATSTSSTSSTSTTTGVAFRDAAYFIFPGLTVELPGTFAIRINIYELNNGPENTLVEVITTHPFTVVSEDAPEGLPSKCLPSPGSHLFVLLAVRHMLDPQLSSNPRH